MHNFCCALELSTKHEHENKEGAHLDGYLARELDGDEVWLWAIRTTKNREEAKVKRQKFEQAWKEVRGED